MSLDRADLDGAGGVRGRHEGVGHVVQVVHDGRFVDADQSPVRFGDVVVEAFLAAVGTVVGALPDAHLIGQSRLGALARPAEGAAPAQ